MLKCVSSVVLTCQRTVVRHTQVSSDIVVLT